MASNAQSESCAVPKAPMKLSRTTAFQKVGKSEVADDLTDLTSSDLDEPTPKRRRTLEHTHSLQDLARILQEIRVQVRKLRSRVSFLESCQTDEGFSDDEDSDDEDFIDDSD